MVAAMRRWISVLLALAGLVGVVGSAAAASGPGPAGPAPDKTVAPTTPVTAPPGSAPPIGTAPLPSQAPPTSAWLVTTSTSTSTTVFATTVPTIDENTSPTNVPLAPTAGFDGLTFLTDVYAAVNDDPLVLIDIAERSTIINSAADLWVAHVLGVSMTTRIHAAPPTPAYTVSAAGKAVSVCTDTGACESFGDFYAPTGLLESFTINGVVVDDVISVLSRPVVVESLSVDTALCVTSTDAVLSCILLMSSDGASAALEFEQALFVGLDGQQFAPDLNLSAYATSIADGDFGSAHLVFPGAPIDGEITFPVVTGVSGAQSTVSVPLRLL